MPSVAVLLVVGLLVLRSAVAATDCSTCTANEVCVQKVVPADKLVTDSNCAPCAPATSLGGAAQGWWPCTTPNNCKCIESAYTGVCATMVNGICASCTSALTSGCTAITCNANKFNTNKDAPDGCEASCAVVPGGVCSACTTYVASGCTAVTCNAGKFDTNLDAKDGCEATATVAATVFAAEHTIKLGGVAANIFNEDPKLVQSVSIFSRYFSFHDCISIICLYFTHCSRCFSFFSISSFVQQSLKL